MLTQHGNVDLMAFYNADRNGANGIEGSDDVINEKRESWVWWHTRVL